MTVSLRSLAVVAALICTLGSTIAEPQDPVTFFNGEETETYLEWLETLDDTLYDRSIFLPSPAGNSTGTALHWKIQGDEIFLAMVAKATGWVGFGIAEAGGMSGADTVIYTASDDSLMDGYILDDRMVYPDDCKGDWELLNSVNDGGFLIVEMKRALDTGDSQDHPIVQDGDPTLYNPSRIIVAWSDSESSFSHGPDNRALSSIRFYGSEVNDFETAMANEAEGFIDLQTTDYPVKEQDTEYHYTCFSYADLLSQGMPEDTELHTIGIEPLIDPRAAKYVHHFILYATTEENVNMANCSESLFIELAFAWAPGEDALQMPPNVGGPLGENGFKNFRLETHYNNPWLDSGILDSSGVRLYYTSQKREHDAGMLMLGDPFVSLNGETVGPATHTFTCPASCSANTLNSSVTVLRENLHMHQTGLTMTNTHMRDGQVIRSNAHVDYFDFDHQGGYAVQQEPFEIRPGDSFQTTCQYMDDKATFGASSQDEMCIAFLLYYPRQKRSLFGLEAPFLCGYNLPIPDCASDYERVTIESKTELERTFGTSTCASTETAPTSGGTLPVSSVVSVAVSVVAVTLALV